MISSSPNNHIPIKQLSKWRLHRYTIIHHLHVTPGLRNTSSIITNKMPSSIQSKQIISITIPYKRYRSCISTINTSINSSTPTTTIINTFHPFNIRSRTTILIKHIPRSIIMRKKHRPRTSLTTIIRLDCTPSTIS